MHEVGPAECQMEARAGVENYAAAFGVCCARVIVRHTGKLRTASDDAWDDHGPIASWCPVPAWRVPASWRAISQTHNTKQPFAASNFLVFRNGIFHAKPLAGDPALASELPEPSS
jgi:hypothetical protein